MLYSAHSRRAWLVVGAGLACPWTALAQTTVTYIGPNNGPWSDPANWSPAIVPANDGPSLFNAIVPASKTVLFDLPAPTQLTGLPTGGSATIKLDLGEQLEILGVNDFAGVIDAQGIGSRFAATGPFSVIKSNARFYAKAGAEIAVRGSSYNWTSGSVPNPTILSADGLGSLLDLSTVGTFGAGYSTGGLSTTVTVLASNGGVVDLSGVANISGPAGSTDDWLRFRAETNGTIDLSKVQTVAGRTHFAPDVSVFSMPALVQVGPGGYTKFVMSAPHVIDLPKLTKFQDGGLSIADGGTINAPNLTQFINAELTISPTRVLNAPPFVSFNNARLHVREGATLKVAAANYAWTSTSIPSVSLSADGLGSLLDLSTVGSFSAGYSTAGGLTSVVWVVASNGGLIDLSGATTITGPGGSSDDWLRFRAETNGTIDFSSVQTVAGRTYFICNIPVMSMPALVQAGPGGYSRFEVSVFNTLNLPELEKIQDGALVIADGGTINAPKLAQFINADLTLTPARFLNAPPFTAINNARLHAREGVTLKVAAPSYAWTTTSIPSVSLSADGTGSILDFSSVATFTANISTSPNSNTVLVEASNGGVIDLSGLTSITGAGGDDWLHFHAESGGRFIFGDVTLASGRTRLEATTDGSRLYFGDLSIKGTGQFILSLAANAHIAGDYTSTRTEENAITLGDGTVFLEGSGTPGEPQLMEVGGADLGIPAGTLPQNFQIGQLIIGSETQSTIVLLVDLVNNGNRGAGGEPELLYCQGFPSEDGLRILPGSTLYLGDIEAYTVIGNEWIRLRDLIPGGQTCIPFDQGTLCIGAPADCYPDCEGDADLDIFDYLCFLNAFTAQLPYADCEEDGDWDLFDYLCFQGRFVGGCG